MALSSCPSAAVVLRSSGLQRVRKRRRRPGRRRVLWRPAHGGDGDDAVAGDDGPLDEVHRLALVQLVRAHVLREHPHQGAVPAGARWVQGWVRVVASAGWCGRERGEREQGESREGMRRGEAGASGAGRGVPVWREAEVLVLVERLHPLFHRGRGGARQG